MARKLAAKSIPAVEAGRPIEPLPNEKQQGNPQGFLIFSPKKPALDYDFYRKTHGGKTETDEKQDDGSDSDLARALFEGEEH